MAVKVRIELQIEWNSIKILRQSRKRYTLVMLESVVNSYQSWKCECNSINLPSYPQHGK